MKFKNCIFLISFLLSSLPSQATTDPRPIFATDVYNGDGHLYIPTATPFGNRACIFDPFSIISYSVTTSDELAFVHGVTSPIQTQINSIGGAAISDLTNDVSATGPGSVAATVNSVGSSSAAHIHSAEVAANAATNANTPSTIVKRDSSGNFLANTITALLNGNASTASALFSSPVQCTGIQVAQGIQSSGNANCVTPTGGITVLTNDVSASGTGSVAATVNSVGGSSAANVHSAELLANAATSVNTVNTIVKRDNSGNFSASQIIASQIGIGTSSPNDPLEIDSPSLGGSFGNTQELFRLVTPTSNDDYLDFYKFRNANGGDWTTASTFIQQNVDGTPMGSIEFNPPGNSGGMQFNTWQGGTPLSVGNSGDVTLGGNLLAATTNTQNLGSSGDVWANIWATLFHGDLSGNSSTATALATTPTQCSGVQVAQGIAANGNANCITPTGGITQLTGDGVAGPGSGSQSLALTYWLIPAISASNAPPGSPVNGGRYVVLSSPSGVWAGNGNKIAVFTSGTPTSGGVTFTNFNNTSAVGNVLSYGNGNFSNNSATTTQSLQNNGDYFSFQLNAASAGQNIIVGVTHVPFSSGYAPSQIDFIMNFSPGGLIYSAENDANYVQISSSWVPSDIFKIQINAGSVAFYQNNTLLATDGVSPTFPLYGADTASLSSTGPTVTESYSLTGAGSWAYTTPPEGSTIDAEISGVYRYHSGAWIALQDAGANIVTSSITLSGVAITNVPSAFLGFSTGSLTSLVANEIIGSGKAPRAMTIENIVASAASFSCIANPVLTLYDCGTSAGTCTGGTAIGSVTLTAANTQTDGTVSSPSLAAGHYWAWEVASGTCTALNATGTAEAAMQ